MRFMKVPKHLILSCSWLKGKVNLGLDLTIELMRTRIKCNKQNWQEVHLRSPHKCTCLHTILNLYQEYLSKIYTKFPIAHLLFRAITKVRMGGKEDVLFLFLNIIITFLFECLQYFLHAVTGLILGSCRSVAAGLFESQSGKKFLNRVKKKIAQLFLKSNFKCIFNFKTCWKKEKKLLSRY